MALNDDIEQRLREAMEEMTRNAQDSAAGIRFEEEARRRATQTTAAFSAAGGTATNTVKDFSKAMTSATEGMGKYGGAVKGLAGGAGDLLSKFGPLGFVVGQLTKLMGAGVNAVLEQNDALIKNYKELSKLGGATTLTTDKILEMANKAGYASSNMGIIAQSIAKANSGMITLGTSHALGIEQFGKLIAVTQKTRDAYFRMGLSQEELTSAQADYVQVSASLGHRQSLSADRQQKQSLAYIDSLVELTTLTGASADEQRRAQDAAAASAAYQVHSYKMTRELDAAENASRAAKARGDTAGVIAAEKNIDTITKRQQAEKAAIATMTQRFGEGSKQVQAAIHLIANDFTGIDENAGQMMVGFGDVYESLKRVLAGTATQADLINVSNKAFDRNIDAFGTMIQHGAKENADALGFSAAGIAKANLAQGKAYDSAAVQEGIRLTKEGQRTDKRIQLQTSINALEVNAKVGMDKMVALISGPVNSAFESLVKGINGFGQVLATVVGHFNKELGQQLKDEFMSDKDKEAEMAKLMMRQAQLEERAKSDAVTSDTTGHEAYLIDKEKMEINERKKRLNTNKFSSDATAGDIEAANKRELLVALEEENRRIAYDMAEKEKVSTQAEYDEKFKTQTEKDAYEARVKKAQDESIARIVKLKEEILFIEEREAKKKREEILKRNNVPTTPQAPANAATPSTEPVLPGARSTNTAQPADKKLLDLIANGEGTSDARAAKSGYASGYDVTLGYGKFDGGEHKPVSQMTLKEVKKLQEKILRNSGTLNSSAVGKYQIVGKTLRGLQEELKLSDDDIFDASLQDKLGQVLLRRRGLEDYRSGKIDLETFQNKAAKEWASISKFGLNEGNYADQRVGTSSTQFKDALHQARDGGIFSGPESGYPVELHGDEVVIPMKDLGDVDKKDLPAELKSTNTEKLTVANFTKILTEQAATEAAARAATPVGGNVTAATQSNAEFIQVMGEMLDKMTTKYDAMIDQLTAINRVQDEILTYTR